MTWALCAASIVAAVSCSTSPLGRHRHAVTAPSLTFMHVGFEAGPAVFTDAAGHPSEERRIEPFGAPIGAFELAARDLNPLAQRSDPATGWSDHGARWMAPETARWLTPDPPVAAPDAAFMAAPWALHPYQYVDQNPVVYWDPDGRNPTAAAVARVVPELPPLFALGARLATSVGVYAVRAVPVVGLAAGPALSIVQHVQHPDEPALECDGCDIIAQEVQLANDRIAADRAAFGQRVLEYNQALIRDRAGTDVPADTRSREGEGNRYKIRVVVRAGGIARSHVIEDEEQIGVNAVALSVGWAIQDAGKVGENGVTDAYDRVVTQLRAIRSRGGAIGLGRLVKESSGDHSYQGAGLDIEVHNVEGWNLRD